MTRDPGPWFTEVLEGLAAQDYPNLSVLVVDAASGTDPTPRVAERLPTAYVRRLDANRGFGASANEVLTVVEGAAFFAFCHDDVVLEPDALRLMVEEAFRSNAGVVGPKVVTWTNTQALLQVGMAVDKTGAPSPYVEPGELDQEQHDAVRDVFYVPGSCTLVRADLFATLGGFDPAIDYLGEDLDLCWRAHVAGARVIVAPAARVRHLEALGERRPVDDRRRLQSRHRLRTVLKAYSPLHLLAVLPQAIVVALFEVLFALATFKPGQAADVAGAWPWNLRRAGDLWQARRRTQRSRLVRDSEIRRFQVRGFARVNAFFRSQIEEGEDTIRTVGSASRELASSLRTGGRRLAIVVWLAVVLLLIFGSRHLLTRGIPAIGELAWFPEGPSALLREFASGWRSAGLGSEAPQPTAYGLLGLGGIVTLGFTGLLRTLLTVGMLPLGLIGMWRLTRPLLSRRARLVGLIVYLAIPLPYNALARGSWSGLVLYGAGPFLLAHLGRASRMTPFDEGLLPTWAQVLGLGLVTALLAALLPSAIVLVVVIAVGIVLGSLLVGGGAGALRALAVAIGAAAVAAVLHLPWALDFLPPGAEWAPFGGIDRATGAGVELGRLLRFQTGPLGAPPLGWAFLVAAALPLLIGRDWRLGWAARAWGVAALSFALAWADQQGWVPVGLPSSEALLAPAAAALALSAALGMAAFELDLPGYRFGWRQMASIVAAAAVVVGIGPVVAGAADGRWDAPPGDFRQTLQFLDDDVADEGAFRVLWVGDPEVMPLGGWRLGEDLAYATSENGVPDVTDLWAGSADGPTTMIADALEVAALGETARLGRLLAPLGIRYVVIVERVAPAIYDTPVHPVPRAITTTMATQLDLRRIDVDGALGVYENAAWSPVRAALPPELAEAGRDSGFPLLAGLDWTPAEPVLPRRHGYSRFTGDVEDGDGAIYFAAKASSRWSLEVDGEDAPRRTAFGWANSFTPEGSGAATLKYATAPLRYALVVLQALLWAGAVRTVRTARRGVRAAA